MLCQNCNTREANVHFTQVINNQKNEMYLCEQCAKEKGQFNYGTPLSLSDLIAGFMGLGNGSPLPQFSQKEVRCETCGMSYDDFQKTGKVGCGDCYKVFGDKMKPVIKRLHGTTLHTGKVPAHITECPAGLHALDALKQQLNDAIKNEEYEKAAQLRDRIRDIEGERQG